MFEIGDKIKYSEADPTNIKMTLYLAYRFCSDCNTITVCRMLLPTNTRENANLICLPT